MSELARGRIAVLLIFLTAGTTIGTWTARIPAVKHRLGVSDGRLSLALLALAAGAIVGMQTVGRLIDRWGSARVMIPAAMADGVLLIPPALATSLAWLAVALFAYGVAHGMVNIAMNAHAVDVERAAGRPMLSSFHAAYSVGGFVGAGVGGAYAALDLSPTATFVTVAALVVGLAAFASTWRLVITAAPRDRVDTASATPAVLFLGVLAFCCLVGEGAAADWSSVYLRDNLASSAGFAALAYAAFSVMMTVGRLAGDGLVARFGPVALVRVCGTLAAVGLATSLVIASPVAGVVGFGCLGAGLSCIAPQVFSAAGNLNPARAGQAIARVASLGYLGFLTGPLMIGGAAVIVGLPRALTIPALLALFVALAAGALRSRRPEDRASAITP